MPLASHTPFKPHIRLSDANQTMRIHNTHAHLRLPDRLAPAKCALMRCEVDDHATNAPINNSYTKNKTLHFTRSMSTKQICIVEIFVRAGVVRERIQKSTRSIDHHTTI